MTVNDEVRAITNHRGKWSQKGVPHRGWRCIDIEDLGEASRICGMCESQEIRYVHYLQHSEYHGALGVGCICAGHMEEDLEGARQRDRLMAGRATKRVRWLSRQWRISAKGNEWIEADGFRVTVYPRAHQWRVTVGAADDSLVHHGRRHYGTVAEAKLAGFDLVTRLLTPKSP